MSRSRAPIPDPDSPEWRMEPLIIEIGGGPPLVFELWFRKTTKGWQMVQRDPPGSD
jgi:hypothetical protein